MITLITEGINIPYEGIFWYINGKLIAFCNQVNPRDPYAFYDIQHKDVWNNIKEKYKVNDRVVQYDYYPRGRVETLPILNSDGTLNHYESSVYFDKCLNKKEIIAQIEDTFRLYLNNVHVDLSGQLFIDGGHYTCHNCR